MAATKVQTQIQQAALYRCTNKVTREVFYTMKSDSTNDWYTQTCDCTTGEWSCDCPAQKPCKHLRAIQEVLKIRRARIAAKIGGDMPATIAKIEAEQEVRAEVAAATVREAEAILAAERAKCSMTQARKVEYPFGSPVLMR